MYISYEDKQAFPFCRLQLLVEKFGLVFELTNKNSVKVPKVLK